MDSARTMAGIGGARRATPTKCHEVMAVRSATKSFGCYCDDLIDDLINFAAISISITSFF